MPVNIINVDIEHIRAMLRERGMDPDHMSDEVAREALRARVGNILYRYA